MPDVQVTIDGQQVSVPAGSTVLDAAKAAGIDIPVLCAHDSLKPIGACRMCLVEVEKQRVLQPACTFPVSQGMVVHTKSEPVLDSRRFVLQLLFSERNHFCMYCQMSGSCELQRLAYEHGLTHWEFDRAYPKLPVDATRKYFVMDHNRCILCRRCIRACDELVGNRTLGLKNRGAETMVIADMDVPFGQSSCVSCGTCLQICPTGALMDRASAYMGATDEIERVKSRCNLCSVGCGVEWIIRGNRVIRVEGDWDAEPNKGLLCEIGRFGLLHEKRQRVRKPLVKDNNGLVDASWEDALQKVATGLKTAGDKATVVISGLASTEAAQAAVSKLPGKKVTMGGALPEANCAPISALDEADLIIVADVDLTQGSNYRMAGFPIKRSARHRGVRVIILDDDPNGLEPWARSKWSPAEAERAIELARKALNPVIVYDKGSEKLAQQLAAQLPHAKLIGFAPEGNTAGLAKAGVTEPFNASPSARAYYVIAGEAAQVGEELMQALAKADFVAVQASFREPWEGVADVILPSPTLPEKSGSFVNTEGRTFEMKAGVKTRIPSEVEIIERLGALL
ncbi:MAG: (2Fe-2S)-binding protein [Chloroflexi bacterium]|nr:(2Fe-2S)-binding protein [Chloroflexota bacterium]